MMCFQSIKADLQKLQYALQYTKSQSALVATPSLWQLKNPHGAIWGGEPANLQQIDSPRSAAHDGRPLLFVHGIEYLDPSEVLTDFVYPFEREARIFAKRERKDLSVTFIHWNSKLVYEGGGQPTQLKSFIRTPLMLAFSVPYFRQYFAEQERRAAEVSRFLVPFAREWSIESSQAPYVISHSLGAFIWAEVVRTLLLEASLPKDTGDWLSLQAALPSQSFSLKGPYCDVVRYYESERLKNWYSLTDIILSTLYVLAKGQLAMGQIGSVGGLYRQIWQKNVTSFAIEAHGKTILTANGRCFFQRIGKLLSQEHSWFSGHAIAR